MVAITSKKLKIILFLKRLKITSNASRNILKAVSPFQLAVKKVPLHNAVLSKSGRNNKGRIVCRTKTSWSMKKVVPKLNYRFRSTGVSCVLGLKILNKSMKLVGMAYTLNGGFTFLQLNNNSNLFSFLYSHNENESLGFLFKKPSYSLLYKIGTNKKLSCLEALPFKGSQYSRSSGTHALLISINMDNHTALVQLPSGHKKAFSIYSTAAIGSVAFGEKEKTSNTKFGFWRKLAKKPTVRGVAKNPVDHPHGGRTKSIKYPRTPWGHTTKYK